jgi:sugar (pentulose or hexulose) kinase
MTCVVGLDIGTTSTIGILVELPGRVRALATPPVTLRAPRPGWAEEDPEEWWRNCVAILRELCARAEIPTAEIAAIGVTGMLPAVVLLDAAGRPLRPSIQRSDGRCGAEVEELRRRGRGATPRGRRDRPRGGHAGGRRRRRPRRLGARRGHRRPRRLPAEIRRLGRHPGRHGPRAARSRG